MRNGASTGGGRRGQPVLARRQAPTRRPGSCRGQLRSWQEAAAAEGGRELARPALAPSVGA
eukprot:6771691-Alexandrium_andersonii.AAC.1